MVETFHSGWLELAVGGLVLGVVSNALFAWSQSPAGCAATIARRGRAALLHGTCDASESGWARVIRAALANANASRVFDEERSRIRNAAAIGLAGVAATLVGAAALVRAQPVAMSVVALAGVYVASRLVENARAAGAALRAALDATASFGAATRAPSHAKQASDVAPMRVEAPGCFGFAFLGITAVPVSMLIAEATRPVDAHTIGMLLFMHVFFSPTALAAGVLVRSRWIALDAERREVVVVRRILGIAYARSRVPLEIVTGFSVEEKRQGRGVDVYVVAETHEGPVRLVSGDAAEKAVATLAHALR